VSSLPIRGLDHSAFAVDDTEAMLRFYRDLGFVIVFYDAEGNAVNDEDTWRAGESRIWAIQFGLQKIFMIPWRVWRARGWTPDTLRAPEARPGTMDVCWVWEGTVEAAQSLLAERGIPVIAGPVERQGGDGGGRRVGKSLYFRDPDENLLEVIVY
jgi:catechol 2,3-dioxygenase-like lactoylglutathione lyase family enzyme